MAAVVVTAIAAAEPARAHQPSSSTSQPTSTTAPLAAASWGGRAIRAPHVHRALKVAQADAAWPAGPVDRGTGYSRPDGSSRVREVQRALSRLGYRPGPVDGRFGPRTEAAVRWFQIKHGLEADGVVGPATHGHLRARLDDRTDQGRDGRSTTPARAADPPATVTAPRGDARDAERSVSPDAASGDTPWLAALGLAVLAAALIAVLSIRSRRRRALAAAEEQGAVWADAAPAWEPLADRPRRPRPMEVPPPEPPNELEAWRDRSQQHPELARRGGRR